LALVFVIYSASKVGRCKGEELFYQCHERNDAPQLHNIYDGPDSHYSAFPLPGIRAGRDPAKNAAGPTSEQIEE